MFPPVLHLFRFSNHPAYCFSSALTTGLHSKRITAEGQKGLPSNGCIESDPADLFIAARALGRRVAPDTALAFVGDNVNSPELLIRTNRDVGFWTPY
jgi:hypothetical protein